MKSPPTFTQHRLPTARLLGKPYGPEDFSFLEELFTDRRVMKTLSEDGETFAHERIEEIHQGFLRHWLRYRFGVWVFELATGPSDDKIGYCGERYHGFEGRCEVEIFYSVHPDHWSKGYASEMVQAVLAYGREQHGIDDVVGISVPSNAASRRVMVKNGFKYERDLFQDDQVSVLYRYCDPVEKHERKLG
mgnify:CR=1 FL=1